MTQKPKKQTKKPTARIAIESNLKRIEELARGGHSIKVICKDIGVSSSSFYEYAKINPEILETVKKGRLELVADIKAALTKKALGYDYEETKTVIKQEEGKQIQTVERVKKHIAPDVGACHLLLKNYDDEWHNDDVTTIALKKKELELKEKKLDAEVW